MFGLSYYGCCEPVDDRIGKIRKAIPNLRTVSISGWNNFQKISEELAKDFIPPKPNPAFISGPSTGKRKEGPSGQFFRLPERQHGADCARHLRHSNDMSRLPR